MEVPELCNKIWRQSYKQENIHNSVPHKFYAVFCYPQSLSEDETSLKGQELYETAERSQPLKFKSREYTHRHTEPGKTFAYAKPYTEAHKAEKIATKPQPNNS